jgi:hypothetical protein
MAFDSFNPAESLIPNDGDLVFDATTGEGGRSPAETVLPYIEQRADPDTIYRDASDNAITGDLSDGGFVIDWTPGDGPKGETVGVIAIIAPPEHDDAGIEWTYCATGQPSADGSSQGNTWAGHPAGEGSSQGIVIDWSGPGDKLTAGFCATGKTSEDGHVGSEGDGGFVVNWTPGDGSSHDAFPTETVFPTGTIHPYEESVHTFYDLVI